MYLVKDIMSKNLITVERELPILEAAELLVKHNITGLPVVDKDFKLVGILSEYDVLKVLKGMSPDDKKTVDDFMTKNVVAFEEDEIGVRVWEFFIDNPTKRRVPIVSNGKLVGLVSRRDIVHQVVSLLRASKLN